jgi:hypothetical protein
MPHSGSAVPRGSSSDVATTPAAVNFDQESSQERLEAAPAPNVQRFTPWFRLAALITQPAMVGRLGLSERARSVLGCYLWRAGRLGQGEGSLPGEAMFWRTQGGIAQDTQLSSGTIKRANAELRTEGLLRWRRVEPARKLPDGRTAFKPTCVYYVAIGELSRRLGIGTKPADEITKISSMRSDSPVGAKSFRADASAPATSISDVNSVVKFNKPPQGNTAHPPPVVVVESRSNGEQDAIGELHALWYDRMGAPHQAPEYVCREVQLALRGAVDAGVPLEDLRDVIIGASDPQLGGEAYRYCRDHDVWRAPLFFNMRRRQVSGCVSHLVQCVRASRGRFEATAKRPAPQPPSERVATPEEALGPIRALLASLEGSQAPHGPSTDEGAAPGATGSDPRPGSAPSPGT